MRALGIPIVVDRVIQQSIAQVLSLVYEPKFSETSYGFRPKRSARQALQKAQEIKNLQRCGIAKWQAWQWANTRKGYWRTVHSPILTRAISNENLKRAHYPTLTEYYEKLHPR